MAKPVIGSYNMSFASDLGLNLEKVNKDDVRFKPSELSFLLANRALNKSTNKSILDTYTTANDPRQPWLNAAKKVKAFLSDRPVAALGLQEMNIWLQSNGKVKQDIIDAYKSFNQDPWTTRHLTTMPLSDYGVHYFSKLIAFPTEEQKKFVHFDCVYGEVPDVKYNPKPALMMIWNKNLLGEWNDEIMGSRIGLYEKRMDAGSVYALNKKDGTPDRSIQFVFTTKNILLINVHALNDANDVGYKHMIREIQRTYNEFLTGKTITISGVYLMGDFNDRYGWFTELTLTHASKTFVLKRGDNPPKSCCYNWDSACERGYNNKNMIELNSGGINDCKPTKGYVDVTDDVNELKKGVKSPLGEPRGKVGNYQYVGDYCFSSNNPGAEIQMFDSKSGQISEASDHEMVFIEIPLPSEITGGRRVAKRTRKKQKRKTQRRHKTQRRQRSRRTA